MAEHAPPLPRVASAEDARTVAALLDDFNREFDTPTPGVEILAARLAVLLESDAFLVCLAGDVAVAVTTQRPSVWYDGPVATLDELYVVPALRDRGIGSRLLAFVEQQLRARDVEAVEINVDGVDRDARRFYERHGYSNVEPGQTEPMLCYYRELSSSGA